MDENKKEIINQFLSIVQMTRDGSDVKEMEYMQEKYDEYVEITYFSGYKKKINVTCDSGKAMLRDTLYFM